MIRSTPGCNCNTCMKLRAEEFYEKKIAFNKKDDERYIDWEPHQYECLSEPIAETNKCSFCGKNQIGTNTEDLCDNCYFGHNCERLFGGECNICNPPVAEAAVGYYNYCINCKGPNPSFDNGLCFFCEKEIS